MSIPPTLKTCLDHEHVHYDVLPHSLTFGARAVARTLRVPEQQVAKVVIVKVKDRFVTTVLPANWQVDLFRLRKIFGTHRVRLATEHEMGRLFPDCEVGAMPPLGTLYGLPVYVDRSLTEDEDIVFEGGTHSQAIRMRYWDFAALVFPTVAEFHRDPTTTC
jgi:Ala-tRNA(Pro) deacylase